MPEVFKKAQKDKIKICIDRSEIPPRVNVILPGDGRYLDDASLTEINVPLDEDFLKMANTLVAINALREGLDDISDLMDIIANAVLQNSQTI